QERRAGQPVDAPARPAAAEALREAAAPSDTIFAPATAAGRAAIAILRISGPDCARAVTSVTGRLPMPRAASRARFVHPETREQLDDGFVLWFPGPRSATGEGVT